ncbi:radical SAM protein [Helicobacter turcicus]|uniref:Radical SAM protein n=2 Tax=Helicobacter turcicus TaxID=2867412 RepID=A0ABS7JQ83_9HELI|nr:radical SAM protein [Helicobacter turcicus]MBX7491561.1 radical SAM protein [Helicobacter turcicus]
MFILNLMVTSKCNYTCRMCPFHGNGYSEDYFKERFDWQCDMSLKEIETILQKAKDYGVKTIDFTPNGEFFTYKNWREVLALTQKYKMQATTTTNGGLLQEQDIKDAVDLGLCAVTISIDSVHYDTYKIVRKPATKQAFENAIHAPILFKQYGDSKFSSGGGGHLCASAIYRTTPKQK